MIIKAGAADGGVVMLREEDDDRILGVTPPE
jgi:hypothetical protein